MTSDVYLAKKDVYLVLRADFGVDFDLVDDCFEFIMVTNVLNI